MSETEASEGEWLSSVLSPKSLILSSILNPEYSILWKHCTFVAVILKFVFFCHKKSTQLLSQMSRKSQQTRLRITFWIKYALEDKPQVVSACAEVKSAFSTFKIAC